MDALRWVGALLLLGCALVAGLLLVTLLYNWVLGRLIRNAERVVDGIAQEIAEEEEAEAEYFKWLEQHLQ